MSNINYTVSVFQELVTRYPTFESLRKFLESEDGGLLKFTDFQENGVCIIKYEKGVSCFDIPFVRWFRSVVWDTKKNYPICVSPPKSTTSDFPYSAINEIKNNIICEEFLDGFMINCFKTVESNEIYYNTRSKIGATGNFYSSKSFKELFNEAFSYTQLGKFTEYNDNITNDFINSNINSPNSEFNEVATFYSYLVQHPEHRNVTPISGDGYRIYNVLSGIVYGDGSVKIKDGVFTKEYPLGLSMEIPKISLENSEKESVQEFIQSLFSEKDWKFQGIVLKDSNGNRWKFRSDKYNAIKSLRGNTNYPSQRFAKLFTENLIKQYLEYYPEDATIFTMCNLYLISIIIHIHDLYYKVHVTKSIGIEEVNKIYHPHLYSIHGIYLSVLRSQCKKIELNDIYDYINKLPWQRVAFLIDNFIICNV